MPYRSGGTYPFTVSLSKKNAGLEKRLTELLGIGRYGNKRSLDESIWDAVDTISSYLVAFGEVFLEIVHEEEDKPNVTSKSLVFLPLGKIIRVFGSYVQVVPIKNWKREEKKFYIIPANKIWHIKLPRKLGTPRRHRKLVKKLSLLSESTPSFVLTNDILGNSMKYDFVNRHHNKDIAVEQITSGWGSIRSLGQIKGTTEYYYIANILQLNYSQALLREHILSEINELLRRLEVKNSIKVDGLVSSTEIMKTIRRLHKGEIGFTEALKSVKD
ncbi:hypothetical protein FACS189431_2180 [Alphaproteobacteria bacterium]|nr:hypothetical protein FACS189431_2180 [Alphaproteobacteria bacterium]